MSHTCVQTVKNTDPVIDACDKMRELCQAKAIDNVSAWPIVLAQEVPDENAAKYGGRPAGFIPRSILSNWFIGHVQLNLVIGKS